MSQINVNAPDPIERVDTSGDRTAAAGINMVTVLIVLAVLAVIAWYLFTGPLRAIGGGSTNVNVTNPQPTTSTTVNINPPGQAPAPAGNTGGTAPGNTAPGGTAPGGNNAPPPANP
ncbi:MAG TPA: hypothetical protein VGQ62_10465 [Chloroflexota bacterium]|jgi:HAMP domain-containing protein|nr:hypothetical protein [Chloroflexota bacterium]